MKNTITHLKSRRELLITLFVLVGSICIIAGSFMPWISLFGGLTPFRGVTGLNGKIFVASGVISGITGLLFFYNPGHRIRLLVGLLGFLQLGFVGFILIGLFRTYQQLSAEPLMIARVGPGLFTILLGTILIFGTLFLGNFTKNAA